MINQLFTTIDSLKNALGLSDIALLLMAVSLVLGMLVGIVAAIAIMMIPEPPLKKDQQQTCKTPRPRKLVSPARHRKESSNRAADRALMQVAQHAVHMPSRR